MSTYHPTPIPHQRQQHMNHMANIRQNFLGLHGKKLEPEFWSPNDFEDSIETLEANFPLGHDVPRITVAHLRFQMEAAEDGNPSLTPQCTSVIHIRKVVETALQWILENHAILLAFFGTIWGALLGIWINKTNVKNMHYHSALSALTAPGWLYCAMVRLLYQPVLIAALLHFTSSLGKALYGAMLSIGLLSLLFHYYGGLIGFGWNFFYWNTLTIRWPDDVIQRNETASPADSQMRFPLFLRPVSLLFRDYLLSLVPSSLITAGYMSQTSIISYPFTEEELKKYLEKPTALLVPNDLALTLAFFLLGLVLAWTRPMGRTLGLLIAQCQATVVPLMKEILKAAPFFLFFYALEGTMVYPVPRDTFVLKYKSFSMLYAVTFVMVICMTIPLLVGMATYSNPLKILGSYPYTFLFAASSGKLRFTLPVFIYETMLYSVKKFPMSSSSRNYFVFHSLMTIMTTRIGDALEITLCTLFTTGILRRLQGSATLIWRTITRAMFLGPWVFLDEFETFEIGPTGESTEYNYNTLYAYADMMLLHMQSDEEFVTLKSELHRLTRMAHATHRRIALVGNLTYAILTSYLCAVGYHYSVITKTIKKLLKAASGGH